MTAQLPIFARPESNTLSLLSLGYANEMAPAAGIPSQPASGAARAPVAPQSRVPRGSSPDAAAPQDESFAGFFDDAVSRKASLPANSANPANSRQSAAPEAESFAGFFDDAVSRKASGGGSSFVDTIDAAVRGAANALTFGFADRLAAGAGAATGIGGERGDYEGNLTKQRALDASNLEQHPVATVGGNIAGAFALPGAAVARAATLPGRMAAGSGVGAAQGALFGASGSEDLRDVQTVAENAIHGAGVGAIIGAASPPLVEGAAKGLGAVGGRVAGAVRGVVNPESEAARRVSAVLARDARVGGQQLDEAALAAAQSAGQPAVVADMGGRVTQSLARSAANTSPEARHALETVVSDRFEGQAPRVSEFVLGLGTGQDALTTRETLQRAAAAANRPAYAKAYAQGGSIWNGDLAQLAQAPDVAHAIKQATRTGANKAAADGFRPVKNPFTVAESGEVKLSDPNVTPTLQFWDHVKRNLDDRISTLQRSGEKSAAADTIALRGQLVEMLDSAAPAYAEARAGAARFFGAQDALEAGQKFVTARGKNSEFARVIGKMSEPERKLFADGFASELATRINETGDRRSVLNSVFNSPSSRQRVVMALGPEKAKEFEAFMRVESLMDGLRRAVTGSSTTARQLAEAGMAGGLAGGILGGGDPRDISIGAMMGFMARSGKVKIDQRLAQRVGEMLASSDPEVFRKAVKLAAKNGRLMDFIRSIDAHAVAAYGSIFGRRDSEAPAF
jgi:hypothetical protein